MKKIQENPWLKHKVENVHEASINLENKDKKFGDEEMDIDEKKQEPQSQEGDLELQNILKDLDEPINLIDSSAFQMDSRYFKLEMQKEYKLLVFENKYVQGIFSLLINSIGQGFGGQDQIGLKQQTPQQNSALAEANVLAPFPFVNSTLNDVHVLYQEQFTNDEATANGVGRTMPIKHKKTLVVGEPQDAGEGSSGEKMTTFDIKCNGVFFLSDIKALCRIIEDGMRDHQEK